MAYKDEIPGIHIRMFDRDTKIRSRNLALLEKAARFCDLTFSEFCRMSAMKEARRVLFQWHEDKIKIAEKTLMDEKIKTEKEKIEEKYTDKTKGL